MYKRQSFARFLTDHGFAVVGHDHLGHGKTASGREEYGYFADQDGWRHIRNDIRSLRTAAGERFPGPVSYPPLTLPTTRLVVGSVRCV